MAALQARRVLSPPPMKSGSPGSPSASTAPDSTPYWRNHVGQQSQRVMHTVGLANAPYAWSVGRTSGADGARGVGLAPAPSGQQPHTSAERGWHIEHALTGCEQRVTEAAAQPYAFSMAH